MENTSPVLWFASCSITVNGSAQSQSRWRSSSSLGGPPTTTPSPTGLLLTGRPRRSWNRSDFTSSTEPLFLLRRFLDYSNTRPVHTVSCCCHQSSVILDNCNWKIKYNWNCNWKKLNPLTLTVAIWVHPAPYRVKLSFVIFDMWALWRSGLRARVPGCQKYKWWLNLVYHRLLFTCTIWQSWHRRVNS